MIKEWVSETVDYLWCLGGTGVLEVPTLRRDKRGPDIGVSGLQSFPDSSVEWVVDST